MAQPPDSLRFLSWADFDEFWRELEASHEQTPYTFDAYDEEVARIAFKAGRESMRRQLAAMIEHLLEARRLQPPRRTADGEARQTATAEVVRSLLVELADDVGDIERREGN